MPLLTMLNGMAGKDPEAAMDRHRAWVLPTLDLKDAWFGTGVEHWTTEQVIRVAAGAQARRLTVGTLSSCLGKGDVERGETAYRSELQALDNLIANARILKPSRIRLVAPSLARRREVADAAMELSTHHPWLFPLLREAVDRLAETGAAVVFENESPNTVFGNPDEVLGFFHTLQRPQARMIWDVGNWWHFGCARFPTVADAAALRPVVDVLHLKGGIAEQPGGALRWAAQLAETSWDVVGIVRAILAGGGCSVICLNPPHGAARPGVTHDYRADLDFLRINFPEISP
jgi:hypothetical protein